MKKSLNLIPYSLGSMLIVLSLIAVSCTQPVVQKNPMEGAWKMIHMKFISDGKVLYEMPGNVKMDQVKMWTAGNFMFVGKYTMDTITDNNFGRGTYTMDSIYVEHVINMNGNDVTTVYRMSMEISNDTLTQTWPLDENGNFDEDNVNVEVYVRLD